MSKIAEVEGTHPLFLEMDETRDFDAPESKWKVLAENNPRKAILQATFGPGQVLTLRVDSASAPAKSKERATFPMDGGQAEWVAHKESVKFTVTYDRVPAANTLAVQFTTAGVALFENGQGGLEVISGTKKVGSLPAPWVEYLPDGAEERVREDLAWKLGDKSFSMNMPALTETEWATAIIDPTVITTSTASTATAYSNQRKIDRTSNGVLWTIRLQNEAVNFGAPVWYALASVYYSTDNGATWQAPPKVSTTESQWIFTNLNNSTTYASSCSFFIDADDYMHVVYRVPDEGYTYYRRGTPNAARTAWTWSAAQAILTGVYGEYPDIVAHREGTGWVAHIVMSIEYNTGSDMRVWHYRVPISSNGTISSPVQTDLHPSPAYGNGNETYPSIDFNHTGDGKTVKDSTPHLYVAWSAGATGAGKGIRFKKATYSGGTWTWGTEREIDNSLYVDADTTRQTWLNCMFDGTRVLITGWLNPGGSARYITFYERDAADTTTTSRLLTSTATSEYLASGSSSYDANGNVYLFGGNTDEAAGTYDLVYRKWTRSGASLGAEVVVDPGVGNPWVSAKRGYSGGRIEFIYTDGTASPYSVTYGSVLLNQLPNAPTVTVGADDVIVGDQLNVSWVHSDPDGNPQAKAQVRYRKAVV